MTGGVKICKFGGLKFFKIKINILKGYFFMNETDKYNLIDWAMLVVTKKYADFSGRARRKEYWMFCLAIMCVSIALGVLVQIPGIGGLFQGITYLLILGILVPDLAASVRRLHDIGKPWPWMLVLLIPCVGWIWFIVLMAKEGVKGDNEFGPDPKA